MMENKRHTVRVQCPGVARPKRQQFVSRMTLGEVAERMGLSECYFQDCIHPSRVSFDLDMVLEHSVKLRAHSIFAPFSVAFGSHCVQLEFDLRKRVSELMTAVQDALAMPPFARGAYKLRHGTDGRWMRHSSDVDGKRLIEFGEDWRQLQLVRVKFPRDAGYYTRMAEAGEVVFVDRAEAEHFAAYVFAREAERTVFRVPGLKPFERSACWPRRGVWGEDLSCFVGELAMVNVTMWPAEEQCFEAVRCAIVCWLLSGRHRAVPLPRDVMRLIAKQLWHDRLEWPEARRATRLGVTSDRLVRGEYNEKGQLDGIRKAEVADWSARPEEDGEHFILTVRTSVHHGSRRLRWRVPVVYLIPIQNVLPLHRCIETPTGDYIRGFE